MTDAGPSPEEEELPDGRLAVTDSFRGRTRYLRIRDRPLYSLLREVLTDAQVPDLMPADMARACPKLSSVRAMLALVEKGDVPFAGVGYGLSYCQRAREAIDQFWQDRGPVRLVAVGCSGSKHDPDDPVPARTLYRGPYWTCKRRYAEAAGDEWRILSAEHGLLAPGDRIDYYQRTPDDLRGIPVDSDDRLPTGEAVTTFLDQWAADVYHRLTDWIWLSAGSVETPPVELEVLLGRKYRDPLEDRRVFDALSAPGDLTVSFPFQDHGFDGNGEQMAWMNEQAEAKGGASA